MSVVVESRWDRIKSAVESGGMLDNAEARTVIANLERARTLLVDKAQEIERLVAAQDRIAGREHGAEERLEAATARAEQYEARIAELNGELEAERARVEVLRESVHSLGAELAEAQERSMSRRHDPATSKAGAADVAVRAGSQRHKLLIAYGGTNFGGLTSDEARALAGISERSCYWKRVSELAQAGLVESFGSRNGELGSRKQVYRITDTGRIALADASR